MNDISLSDLAAVVGNRGDNDGFGDGGGWWILLLFILLGGFGGRGYGYGNNGGGAGDVGGNQLYPWLNQSEQVSNGFRDQMLNTQVNGIQQSVTNGFGEVQNTLCNGFNQTQMAMMQGFNGVQAQQAQCCCDNQLAMANQTATILAEHCSDRAALSDGVRDIIAANQASTQRILDQMCQDKIDEKNEEIANLRQQVNMMNLAASQQAQTAQILADNFAQTNALEQYLAPVPRPAYVVQNPNCCQQAFGCGCAA